MAGAAAGTGLDSARGAGRQAGPAAPALATRDYPGDYAAAWRALPREIVFVDLETTGFGKWDRIVALGLVRLTTDPIEIVTLHLVFNPERRCSPGATGVHGFTNELLASQDPFGPYAAALSAWIGRAELVVAHNMEFDRRFLDEAFVSRGLPPIGPATACTMLEWRALGSGGARLDDIVARLQLTRRDKHGALEDAWLTMQAFLWLRGCPWKLDFAWIADPGPANLRAVAPPPPPAPKPPPLPKRPRGRPRKTEAKKDAGQTSPAA